MTHLNMQTGEIVESSTALATVDQSSAVSVIGYLEQARSWLSTCVEMTGPEQIARAKAEIATAAEATKQLHLSKEIQLDAQEMVRRAEYALGKSIRKGQAEGTVASHGGERRSTTGTPTLTSPSEFASKQELSGAGHGQPGIYHLTDGFQSIEDFDAALEKAKAEGNLSRANVARKAREKSGQPAGPAPAEAGTRERKHQEAELINAFASIVRRSLTPKNVSTLSPKAKQRLVAILNSAIQTLEGTDQ
jgi:hypothetical protein